MLKILDTTLREGEQTDSVFFTVEEKLKIAKMLDEFGIDIIEAGAPIVSKKIFEAVKKIAQAGLKAKILAHCRPIASEIDQAVSCKVDQVGIFLATSDLHLKERLHMSRQQAIKISIEGIKYAKKNKLEVRYTPEDATRTDINYLLDICKKAKQAGADRIGIVDTVGVEQPESFGKLVKIISENVEIPIEVHCHNDFGLALANCLSGIKNGAAFASVTVNGIGERCGITDLIELVMVLKVLEKQNLKYNISLLSKLSSYIEKLSGITLAKNKPILGKYAFSHKGGLHTDAVLKNSNTYEAYDPSIIGKQRSIIVDRFAGKRALAHRLEKLGIKLNEEQLISMLKEVKEHADHYKFVDDSAIMEIVHNYKVSIEKS